MDRQVWNRAQGAKVNFLAITLLRIARSRSNKRSEVADAVDLIVRQHLRTEGGEIEPSVRRLAQAAVVEIEGVNIDVGFEGHKKQKPQDCSGGLAPLARRLGGDITKG